MNPFEVLRQVTSFMIAPVICRAFSHRWHLWQFHTCPLLVCERCGVVSERL